MPYAQRAAPCPAHADSRKYTLSSARERITSPQRASRRRPVRPVRAGKDVEATGLTREEVQGRSFVKILANRRKI